MKTEVRKRYTSEEKVSILKEHLLEKKVISDLCEPAQQLVVEKEVKRNERAQAINARQKSLRARRKQR